jgi:lipopolysaccharide transport system permease protein
MSARKLVSPPSSASPSDAWDLVIRPKTGWLDLHLADLWRYRDLTMIFVWRDFVAQYKQTILGPVWYIAQPVLTMLMFTLIFGRVAGISTEGVPQPLFYLCGIAAWSYFADCLTRTSGTFINNASIFGKVYFPRLTVPVSLVISGLIKFAIQFGLFLVMLLWFMLRGTAVHPNAALLLAPCSLLLMAALGLGGGIIVSALTTKYRDLQHLVTFGVQLAMYATPIVYPLSSVPAKYRWIILANPMSAIVETFRYGFLGSGTFSPMHLLYSAAVTVLTLIIGVILFNHVEQTFMDVV